MVVRGGNIYSIVLSGVHVQLYAHEVPMLLGALSESSRCHFNFFSA